MKTKKKTRSPKKSKKMKTFRLIHYLGILMLFVIYTNCKVPLALQSPGLKAIPDTYTNSIDTSNTAELNWKEFFQDRYLVALIDTAIHNNPDVLMTLQNIEIARYRVGMKDAFLHPFVMGGASLGLEKVGRYTSQGAGDASAEITPGKLVPEHLADITLGLQASWEADIWGKLRNAKKAAFTKYLGSIEGKNFVVTNLVAEIANSYYDLLSLDNSLEIIRENIRLQQNQLDIVKIQKEASVVTELAVKQFEAQVYNSQSLQYEVQQKITETENTINFLLGRYPQRIDRDKTILTDQTLYQIKSGIPSQLLKNRPDIKEAEYELMTAKLDVRTAQLEFYPTVGITSRLGMQAFKPGYLLTLPESLLYSLAGDLVGPIINRRAITAEFNTANAYQVQALYNYQKAILNGFVEVANELSSITNLDSMYTLKSKEAAVLTNSIDIANDLFKSARANYLEILTAQRDALSAKLDLVEVRKRQFNSIINLYRALGGGWK